MTHFKVMGWPSFKVALIKCSTIRGGFDGPVSDFGFASIALNKIKPIFVLNYFIRIY